MEVPKWLRVTIWGLIALGFWGLGYQILGECRIPDLVDIGNFALVLTLAAILAYAYYTYLLAKDAWTLSASLNLQQVREPGNIQDKYTIFCHIQNHSKYSLNCWCNINATVYGQPISMEGFYGSKSPWDLQPFGGGVGNIDIIKILGKVDKTIQDMKEEAPFKNIKEQLRFNIDFWYSPVSKKNIVIHNPLQPFYFDFTRTALVWDV